MNFQEAEAYLYSLGNEVSAMKLGLDAMRVLLAALGDPQEIGDPQEKYLKVQVAGTNGKGSVCAFLDSICNAAGIKTGTFTSPHLVSITERVRINGTDIGEEDFGRHATVVREVCERLVRDGTLETLPTFFEQVTAIALVAFADAGVEVAILETGLGGRLDATTAANAEIAAITRIDLDHQEYLGNTIEEIAAEKAAIIREGSRVVVGAQQAAAMRVILDRCHLFGIMPRTVSDEGGNTSGSECAPQGSKRDGASSLRVGFPPERLGLEGRHQVENAAVAVAVSEILGEYFPITKDEVIAGLESARHPGRLEYRGHYLFDGAHNAGGAKALAEYLKEFETRPITLVFGVMEDKDVGGMAEVLFPLAENILIATVANPRAMDSAELLKSCDRALWGKKVVSAASGVGIINEAEALAGPNSLILVTGSLYLVGEVKRLISNAKFEI